MAVTSFPSLVSVDWLSQRCRPSLRCSLPSAMPEPSFSFSAASLMLWPVRAVSNAHKAGSSHHGPTVSLVLAQARRPWRACAGRKLAHAECTCVRVPSSTCPAALGYSLPTRLTAAILVSATGSCTSLNQARTHGVQHMETLSLLPVLTLTRTATHLLTSPFAVIEPCSFPQPLPASWTRIMHHAARHVQQQFFFQFSR